MSTKAADILDINTAVKQSPSGELITVTRNYNKMRFMYVSSVDSVTSIHKPSLTAVDVTPTEHLVLSYTGM